VCRHNYFHRYGRLVPVKANRRLIPARGTIVLWCFVSLSGRAAINLVCFVQRKLVTVVAAITYAIAPVPVALVAWRRAAPVIVAAPA
jgi:hypothetical protein